MSAPGVYIVYMTYHYEEGQILSLHWNKEKAIEWAIVYIQDNYDEFFPNYDEVFPGEDNIIILDKSKIVHKDGLIEWYMDTVRVYIKKFGINE